MVKTVPVLDTNDSVVSGEGTWGCSCGLGFPHCKGNGVLEHGYREPSREGLGYGDRIGMQQASPKRTRYLLSEFLPGSLQRLPQLLRETGIVHVMFVTASCHVRLGDPRETGSVAFIRCVRRPLSKNKGTEVPSATGKAKTGTTLYRARPWSRQCCSPGLRARQEVGTRMRPRDL